MLNSKHQVTTWKQAGNTWRTDAILLCVVRIWKNLAQSGKITRLNVFSNWMTSCRSLILAFHNILTQKCMIHHGNWIRVVVNIKAREIFHKSRKVCCVKRWYKRWRKRRKMKEINIEMAAVNRISLSRYRWRSERKSWNLLTRGNNYHHTIIKIILWWE